MRPRHSARVALIAWNAGASDALNAEGGELLGILRPEAAIVAGADAIATRVHQRSSEQGSRPSVPWAAGTSTGQASGIERAWSLSSYLYQKAMKGRSV